MTPGLVRRFTGKVRQRFDSDRGAVLVVTAVSMITLIAVAAYAIDTAIWFVHHRHLQTQADAASLAAAEDFQYPCTPSATWPAATPTGLDGTIVSDVHQYDGSGQTAVPAGYAGPSPINQQVPKLPTYSTSYNSSAHNLFSLVNQPNYINQTSPGDPAPASGETSWGGPCADGVIDVKMTETNLKSFFLPLPGFSLFGPSYINAQARVSLENLQSVNAGLNPLAEPLPTPTSLTAYLIDEGNNNQVLGTVNLTSTNSQRTSWTANGVSLPINGKGPIGMELAEAAGTGTAPCDNTNGDQCFDTTDSPNIGVTYTRLWSNSGTPGLPLTAPVQPQASNIWLVPNGAGCGSGPGGSSNFVSSSTTTNVQLCANMTFTSPGGTAFDCTNTSLVMKAGGTSYTMNCPSNNNPNGIWSSASVPVSPSSGPTNFTLAWSVTAGKKPAGSNVTGGDNSGNCTAQGNKPCQGSFDNTTFATPEVVQRVFSGAYDSGSSGTSKSGNILSAAVTVDPNCGPSTSTYCGGASVGSSVVSIQKNASPALVDISVGVLGFQNSQTIGSPPLLLTFGGQQANGFVTCPNQSAGNPQAQQAIATGCVPPNNNFELNTNTTASPCTPTQDPATNAYVCLPENPGSKLSNVLDPAMNQKIYGNASANRCTSGFNYWAGGNSVSSVLRQQPPDPRLLELVITDYGALSNGRNQVPIRAFADFYVTGWQGDPCIGKAPGTSANGLNYTGDDDPTAANPAICTTNNGNGNTLPSCAGVLYGHFVQFTVPPGQGTGTGQCSQSSTLGNCIAVLTK